MTIPEAVRSDELLELFSFHVVHTEDTNSDILRDKGKVTLIFISVIEM